MEINIEIIKRKIKEAGGSERGSLSDVLLAIKQEQKENVFVTSNGEFGELLLEAEDFKFESIPPWNLLEDSLEKQNPETLAFLASILSDSK